MTGAINTANIGSRVLVLAGCFRGLSGTVAAPASDGAVDILVEGMSFPLLYDSDQVRLLMADF